MNPHRRWKINWKTELTQNTQKSNVENAEKVTKSQNEQITMCDGLLKPKFTYKDNNKVRNLVIEVESQIRMILVDKKLRAYMAHM